LRAYGRRAAAGVALNSAKDEPIMSPPRKRADILLVERGLFESRARAQAAIEAGLVMANDKPVTKPSETIAADAALQAQPAHPFVSRGGVKLAGALEQYPIEIEGHVCLDVGASTGGFTEVLLANGANLVFSIDVGREQLHPSLRGHPKIVSMEETDIRAFEGRRLPMRPDIVVIDVSFISLKAVLPVALSLAGAPMHLLALIKPQFEAARKHSKRGIIRNAMVHQEICDDIAAFAASLGCTGIRVFPSSIAGGDGNIEFFIGARRG
jgi:23S rRNA (cytidine1920-2'-O)/16S rRNA (cytidine1409-2'-O)-methyltransferase